jgi:hypothetical protein
VKFSHPAGFRGSIRAFGTIGYGARRAA